MFVILLFFLAVFLIYAYIIHNGEFTATASAIRQIWSGNCRLSCRQSEYSSFSGLSGLPAGTSTSPATSHKYSSRPFCVCETCPCALIDDILSKWRPVTTFYNDSLNFLSTQFCGVIETFNDTFGYFTRVANCRTSCQRPAQLTTEKQLDSSQNICFGNPSRKSRAESRIQGVKALLLRRKSTAAEEKQESEDEDEDIQMPMSSNVIESTEQADTMQTKSCSKCIEKGFTCMKNCPRAKKN